MRVWLAAERIFFCAVFVVCRYQSSGKHWPLLPQTYVCMNLPFFTFIKTVTSDQLVKCQQMTFVIAIIILFFALRKSYIFVVIHFAWTWQQIHMVYRYVHIHIFGSKTMLRFREELLISFIL